MSKRNDRKLSLKKETLRKLYDGDLQRVVGGASGPACLGNEGSGRCGSVSIDDCAPIETGGVIIKIGIG